MTSRFVSIGIPVYNGGEDLRKALDSLLAQTHTNFELIISDNASTDKVTQAITEEYAKRDSRIRLFRQPKTQTATENFLFVLAQARGEYFLWSAHDDTRSDNYLEVLARRLDQTPDAVLSTPETRITTTARAGTHRVATGMPAPNADRWKTLDLYLNDCLCVWIYGLFRTTWLKDAASELPQYEFHGGDMVWMFDVVLRGKLVGDSDATFFYNVTHVNKQPRSSRQKIRTLAIEIYHMTRLTKLRLPPNERMKGYGKVLKFLIRHRISRRNPIGTTVHMLKLAMLGAWIAFESGLRSLFGLRPITQ